MSSFALLSCTTLTFFPRRPTPVSLFYKAIAKTLEEDYAIEDISHHSPIIGE